MRSRTFLPLLLFTLLASATSGAVAVVFRRDDGISTLAKANSIDSSNKPGPISKTRSDFTSLAQSESTGLPTDKFSSTNNNDLNQNAPNAGAGPSGGDGDKSKGETVNSLATASTPDKGSDPAANSKLSSLSAGSNNKLNAPLLGDLIETLLAPALHQDQHKRKFSSSPFGTSTSSASLASVSIKPPLKAKKFAASSPRPPKLSKFAGDEKKQKPASDSHAKQGNFYETLSLSRRDMTNIARALDEYSTRSRLALPSRAIEQFLFDRAIEDGLRPLLLRTDESQSPPVHSDELARLLHDHGSAVAVREENQSGAAPGFESEIPIEHLPRTSGDNQNEEASGQDSSIVRLDQPGEKTNQDEDRHSRLLTRQVYEASGSIGPKEVMHSWTTRRSLSENRVHSELRRSVQQGSGGIEASDGDNGALDSSTVRSVFGATKSLHARFQPRLARIFDARQTIARPQYRQPDEQMRSRGLPVGETDDSEHNTCEGRAFAGCSDFLNGAEIHGRGEHRLQRLFSSARDDSTGLLTSSYINMLTRDAVIARALVEGALDHDAIYSRDDDDNKLHDLGLKAWHGIEKLAQKTGQQVGKAGQQVGKAAEPHLIRLADAIGKSGQYLINP